jgi:hypothetical protein
MTIKFKIYIVQSKTVHVPSSDYYAKGGESSEDTIEHLSFVDEFNTLEEAEKDLEEIFSRYPNDESNYVILKSYTK